MSFLTRLRIEEVDEEHRNWKLLDNLDYAGNQQVFSIPRGFVTNFASVPQIFWSMIAPWGRHMKPAVMHDYFYRTAIVSRLDADRLFYRMMKQLGVSWWKRQVIYRAVRLFGATYYHD